MPLFPWQQCLLDAAAQGRTLTVDVPRRYGLSLGPRLAHRVNVDLLTGKRTDSFTVIIDDPLADDLLGRVDAGALGRWEDDGGRA